VRDLSNRLHDYLEGTVLPRLLARLGSGWQAQGFTLTAPGGQELSVRLVYYTRQLVFERATDADLSPEERPGIAVDLFVPPESLAEAIRDELLSQGTRENTAGSSTRSAPTTTDSSLPPSAEVAAAAL
jgi:hypothetical protein